MRDMGQSAIYIPESRNISLGYQRIYKSVYRNELAKYWINVRGLRRSKLILAVGVGVGMDHAVASAVDKPRLRPGAVVDANAVGSKVCRVLIVVAVLGSEHVDGVCARHGHEETGRRKDLKTASAWIDSSLMSVM